MAGHGHVTPNADGSKARCGGPAICHDCAVEYARTARFTDKKAHLFKEVDGGRGKTCCGLSEREDIWKDRGDDVTCGHCIRQLAQRVNEIGRKVDGITIGPGGALYG